MGLISFLSYWTLFPEDQLRYGFCLFGLYPLCVFYQKYLYKMHISLKHVFSIIFGILTTIYCFGWYSPIHSLCSALIVYGIMHYFPKRSDDMAFAFCMLHISLLHIHRMWFHWMVWTVDVTGTQMLLMIKLTSFAFDYAEKEREELPGLLEWLGYVYFFPSFLVGPTISFANYKSFVSDTKKRQSALKNSMQALCVCLFYIVMMYCRRFYYIEYLTTDEYAEFGIFKRILIMYIIQFIIRCKYYFAWTFSHACYLACGYQESSLNVNVLDIEFGQNVYQITNNWNICTNEWLKVHIFKRACKLGYSKGISTYITNVVSALWHGFYPGYLLTFLMGGVSTELGRRIRKKIRPYFLEKGKLVKFIYDVICTITMCILVSYGSLPFQLYSFSDSMLVWYRLWGIGHVPLILGFILVFLQSKYQRKSKRKVKKVE